MDRLLKILDAVLGVADESIEERLGKSFLGLLLPLFPLWFGITSILSGQSKFLGRGGLMNLSGTAAIIAGNPAPGRLRGSARPISPSPSRP